MNASASFAPDRRRPATHTEWRQVEAELLCPITQVMFENPVVAPDGGNFEREAIMTWMAHDRRLPTSGLQVPADWAWPPNRALRRRVARAAAGPRPVGVEFPPGAAGLAAPAPASGRGTGAAAATSARGAEPSAHELLRFELHDLTGQQTSMFVPASLRVGQLKEQLEQARGIPADQQRIILAGRQLDDARTLLSQGVTNGCRLALFLRIEGD